LRWRWVGPRTGIRCGSLLKLDQQRRLSIRINSQSGSFIFRIFGDEGGGQLFRAVRKREAASAVTDRCFVTKGNPGIRQWLFAVVIYDLACEGSWNQWRQKNEAADNPQKSYQRNEVFRLDECAAPVSAFRMLARRFFVQLFFGRLRLSQPGILSYPAIKSAVKIVLFAR
jgi:hypothetical protein